MKKSTTVHSRIEPNVKEKAENILARLGLTPTQAIRLFYNQIALNQAIPFPIKVPNKLTQKTLTDSSEGKNLQSFNNTENLFASWEQ